jgi:hypothetical protein
LLAIHGSVWFRHLHRVANDRKAELLDLFVASVDTRTSRPVSQPNGRFLGGSRAMLFGEMLTFDRPLSA